MAGQSYVTLKPVVGVHLLDFELFEDYASSVWQFEMRDRRHPAVRLGDELSLHVVELPKAERLARMRADPAAGRPTDPFGGAVVNADADESTAAPLNAWIAFLKHWKEPQEMSDLSYPPVQQAMKKLQDLSRNE